MNMWLLSKFGLVVLWWCAESLSYQDSNVLEIKIFGIGFAYDLSCKSKEVITKFHMKFVQTMFIVVEYTLWLSS